MTDSGPCHRLNFLRLGLAALLLASCQTARPDFTGRTLEDCEHGDYEACRMLSALEPAQPTAATPARPAPPRRLTPVASDVEAMLKGIARARASPHAGTRENLPAPGAPVHGIE